MKTCIYGNAAVCLISVLALVGCGEKTSAEKPAFDAAKPAAREIAKPARTADNSVTYYSENLNTALSVWKECQKRGPEGMTDAELENCSNAQSAWELQPAKARK